MNATTDAPGTLFAPSGAEVAFFAGYTQQEFTLQENGTYVLKVTANDLVTTGTYNAGI